MTTTKLLASIAAYLQPLVESANGTWAVSETVQDTLALLSQAPNKWRCILQWQRADAVGELAVVETVRMLLVIQHNKGLPMAQHADAAGDRAGDPAILARADQVKAWTREIRVQDSTVDRRGPKFRSCYWLVDDSIPHRQLALEFEYTIGMDAIQPVAVPVAGA